MNKPTISEIAAYCTSRNNNIDAETFWHHYESNGWKVGKNAIVMSNWKSAVITWEKRNPEPKEITRPPKPDKPPKPVNRMRHPDGNSLVHKRYGFDSRPSYKIRQGNGGNAYLETSV